MSMDSRIQVAAMLHGDKLKICEAIVGLALKHVEERIELAIADEVLPSDDVRTLVLQYIEKEPEDCLLLSGTMDKQTLLLDMMAYLSAASQIMEVILGKIDSCPVMDAVLDVFINETLSRCMAKGEN